MYTQILFNYFTCLTHFWRVPNMIYVRVPSTTQKYIGSIKFGTGIHICRLPFAYMYTRTDTSDWSAGRRSSFCCWRCSLIGDYSGWIRIGEFGVVPTIGFIIHNVKCIGWAINMQALWWRPITHTQTHVRAAINPNYFLTTHFASEWIRKIVDSISSIGLFTLASCRWYICCWYVAIKKEYIHRAHTHAQKNPFDSHPIRHMCGARAHWHRRHNGKRRRLKYGIHLEYCCD